MFFEPTVTAKDKSYEFSDKQVHWQNHCPLTAILIDACAATDVLLL